MALPFNSAGNIKSTGGNVFGTNMSLDACYVYSVVGATPAATPTDIITLTGSASKLIRVRKIILGGLATAAGSLIISLIRRSTAASGGTSTAPTPLKMRNGDVAATATVALYTANPTVGTAVGTLQSVRVPLQLTAAMAQPVQLDFAETPGICLQGTSDILAINGAGGTVPTNGVLDIAIYWTEE